MNVESQPAGPCRLKLFVRAEAAETRADYEKIVGLYVGNSRLPGFRPGKAPRPVVERHYRREIDADVHSHLVGRFYRQALDEGKVAAVAIVDVTDILFTPETGLSFTAVVDVAPDFKLPKYKRIPLKVETPAVADAQVDERVNRLRNMLAQFQDAPGDPAGRGDLVQIDYDAACDGKPLKELCADCGGLAEGKDFWAQVDEPEFVPGLALALQGSRAGDSRTIEVAFPKDFHVESVRGRKAAYQVAVKAVRRRVMPADEEVCQRLGLKDLAALRDRTRQDLQAAAEAREKERQRQEIVEFLLKRTEFDLPQSVVAEETQLAVRGMLHDIVGRGATREDLEKNREAILGAATTQSKERVRLRYILARIAAEEKVEVSDAEVDARLKDLAARYRQPVEKLRATIEERHGLETLRADIRAEKTIDLLVADAKAR
jgi:trigger factor